MVSEKVQICVSCAHNYLIFQYIKYFFVYFEYPVAPEDGIGVPFCGYINFSISNRDDPTAALEGRRKRIAIQKWLSVCV